MVVLITSSQEVTGFALPHLQPLPDYLQENIAQLEADYQGALLPEFSLRKLHEDGAKCISTVALGQEFAAENNTSPTEVLAGPIPLAQLHQDATTARQALLQFLKTGLPSEKRHCDPLLDILALPRHTRFGGQEVLGDMLALPEPCMPLAFESQLDTRQALRDLLPEVILAQPCDIPPDLPSANESDIITIPQKVATAAVDEDGENGSPKPKPDYLQAFILSSANIQLATDPNSAGMLTLPEPVFFEETTSHIKLSTAFEPSEDLNWKWAVEHACSKASPEEEALPCTGVEELRALGEPLADWKPEKLPVLPCKNSNHFTKQSCSILTKLLPSIDALQWTSKLGLLPAADGQPAQTRETSLSKATRCAIQPVECPMPPMAFFSETGQKGCTSFLTLSAFPEITRLPVDDAAAFLLTGNTENNTDAAAAPQESGSLSLLWALVAKEMMPDDGCYMLPPVDQVLVNSSSIAKTAGGGNPRCLTVRAALAECGVALTMSTAGEALYLDWGLSTKEASLRPIELLEACKKTSASLCPGPIAVAVPNNKRTRCGARFGRDVVLQNLLDLGGCKDLLETGRYHIGATLSISTAPQSSGKVEAVACLPFVENTHNKAGNPPPAKCPRKGGLQFFVGLQNPSIPGTGKVDLNAEQQGNSSRIQEVKISEMSEGMPSPPQRAIQRIETSLSPAHTALYEHLRQEDASLLFSLPSELLSSDVANAPFPDVGAIGAFLRSRLQGHSRSAPKTPMDAASARALGSMAVCRQAAALLLHHGVRSAGLYLEASIRELPGVLAACTAVQAVQVLAGKVEAGDGEDHPKHTALRRSLISMATLIPGAKHLVIGDPKSFFSLYSIIRAAGLCPCHLDPSGQLLAAGADPCAVREAVASACQLADCVLVAVDLLTCSSQSTSSFPLDMFQHVVVYSTEAEAQQSALACLEGSECSITLLQIAVPVAPTKRVEERPRSQMRAVVEHHVSMKTKAAAAPLVEAPLVPAPDWPLVLSSSPERPIKKRTALYEGLLGLERSGTVIVERLMQRIDLVLSPSAALVVVLCEYEQPEFDDFYNATSETLQRASYSFTKLFFVCEGNVAFRAQVLCGMPRLLALAASFGVTLQCNVTTDTSSTAAAVQTVAEAYLMEWKSRKTGRHYIVGDPPSPQEFFLERFPSLNAHSAAVLARCGLSLQEVLSLDSLPAGKIPALLGLVPTQSMELFLKCAAFGDRLVGAVGAPGVGVGGASAREGAHFGMEMHEQHQHGDPLQENVWRENPLHCVVPSHQAKRPRLEQLPTAAAAVVMDASDGDERAAYAAWFQQQHQEEARQYQQAYEQQYQATFQATSAPGEIQDMPIPDLACLEDFLADDAGCGSEATPSPNWRGGPLGGHQHPHPGSLTYLQRPGPSSLGGRHVGRQGVQQHHMQPQAQQAQHVFYPAQSAYTTAAPAPAPFHGARQFASQKRAYSSEVDEFGMPLDSSVLFQVDGEDDGEDEVSMSMNNGPHHISGGGGGGGGQRVRFWEQQQGCGDQMQQRQQQQQQHQQRHTVSDYARQGGQQFPVPGPGYLLQQQHLQQQQAPSDYGYVQHGGARYQGGAPMYQQTPVYNGMPQQQPGGRPMPQPQFPQQPSVGGARGYTAAALQQKQPTQNHQGGLTSPTSSAGYMRRKWGAASYGKGRRGSGRSGGGGKYTSRTSRQW